MHTCANHRAVPDTIWTHVKNCPIAGSWAGLMCGNQRWPLARKLVLVRSLDMNAVCLSSRLSLIFKRCTSRSCSYGHQCRGAEFLRADFKNAAQQSASIPLQGSEGGREAARLSGRVADASRLRNSQLVVRANRLERPRATAAHSPVSARGVCGLFQSSRNHQRPSAHLWKHHVGSGAPQHVSRRAEGNRSSGVSTSRGQWL